MRPAPREFVTWPNPNPNANKSNPDPNPKTRNPDPNPTTPPMSVPWLQIVDRKVPIDSRATTGQKEPTPALLVLSHMPPVNSLAPFNQTSLALI